MQLEGTATAELAGLSRASRRSFRVGAKHLPLIVALAAGWFIWHIPPAASMDPKGFHFLGTLTVAVTLWVFAWLDDYVVGLMLLLSWVVLEVVPSKVALAGFSRGRGSSLSAPWALERR